MGMRKYMAWNFVNVFYCGWSDDGGTIEFRRPPGVTNPDDCLAWVELAIYFTHAARELQGPIFRLDAQYTRDVAGLQRFIHDGLSNGAPKPTYLHRLFHGKAGRIPPMIHIDQEAHSLDGSQVEGQALGQALGCGMSPGEHRLGDLSPIRDSARVGDFLSILTGQTLGGLLSPCLASPRSTISVM